MTIRELTMNFKIKLYEMQKVALDIYKSRRTELEPRAKRVNNGKHLINLY